MSFKGFWHFQRVDIRARTFLQVKLSKVKGGRHVFLRWICLATGCHPCSTLRLVAKQHFCYAIKSWTNVMPEQFHTIIMFVCVHVVEYVPSTRLHVFLAHVTERLERNILMLSAMLYPAIFFFFFHSSISWWEWGCGERAVPTHERVSDHASMLY